MELRTDAVGLQYGSDTWGVRDVDLKLGPGVHGLLGPNGAGKSTLLQMITTVAAPTEGTVYWNGTDVTASPEVIRSSLGYLPQDFGVYPNLTLSEFLRYVASLRGLDAETTDARVSEVIELVNLRHVRDDRLETFSGGMRQRAGIAQALVADPDLLVVDEPTVGLDPEQRVRFRTILSELASERVVLLSTHIVPDIEATANSVVLLSEGRVLDHDTPEALVSRVEEEVFELTVSRDRLRDLRDDYQVCSTVQRADGVEVRVVADEAPQGATPVEPTLEDAYLEQVDPVSHA